MNQVWFSGSARLPIVMLEGVVVGLLDDAEIVLRTALLHALHQVAKLGQREGRRSNLLAQARHDGLYPPGKRAPQKAVGTLIRLYLRNLTAFHSAASFVARYSGNDWSNLPARTARPTLVPKIQTGFSGQETRPIRNDALARLRLLHLRPWETCQCLESW